MVTVTDKHGQLQIPTATNEYIDCPGCNIGLFSRMGYGKDEGRKRDRRNHWVHFIKNVDCEMAKKMNKRIAKYEKKKLAKGMFPIVPVVHNIKRVVCPDGYELRYINRVEDMCYVDDTPKEKCCHLIYAFIDDVLTSNDHGTYMTFAIKNAYACLFEGKKNIYLRTSDKIYWVKEVFPLKDRSKVRWVSCKRYNFEQANGYLNQRHPNSGIVFKV